MNAIIPKHRHRLWTAVVTPFDEQLRVCYDDLEKLLREQDRFNNGILILGSTGENLSLSEKEKKEILEFTLSLKLKAPIMVGVGGFNIVAIQEWLDYCEKLPIHAYLMVTPLYAKPGPEGQYHWFKTLFDQVTRPCMLYNIPSRTGVSLDRSMLHRLQNHPNLWALKEASGKPEEFSLYKKELPNIQVFSGDDAIFPILVARGAQGLVSVSSNAWPEQTHHILHLCLEDANLDVDKIMPTWKQICNTLFITSNPVPIKALLHLQGKIKTPLTRPPLSHLDLANPRILLETDKLINEWRKRL